MAIDDNRLVQVNGTPVGSNQPMKQGPLPTTSIGGTPSDDKMPTEKAVADADDTVRFPPASSVSSSSGTLTCDISNGLTFTTTLTENVTTFSFTNPASAGNTTEVTLLLTQDSTARTVDWGASIYWADGTEPDLSTSDGIYLMRFLTTDGGTTWYGWVVSSDMFDNYSKDAQSMARNIGTGNEAYYMDYNEYAPDLATLQSEAYISSYTLSDTGAFQYWLKGDKNDAAHWEGTTRTYRGVVGRFVYQQSVGTVQFMTPSEFTTWYNNLP